MSRKTSGILFHLSSIPSPYGIGDLGPHAYAFVDFLKKSGQSYWQILPINPTDGINGHSPYSCSSAFAGNYLFISPDMLVMDGFIKASDLKQKIAFDKEQVDYPRAMAFKQKILDIAFNRFKQDAYKGAYELFTSQHKAWLDDFAVFVHAKQVYQGLCWNQWPKALKDRQPKTLEQFKKKYAKDLEKIKFVQFLFYRQWLRLKAYANERKVLIIGDIPIYVTYDSVDVWCNRSIFKLDKEGRLKFISGCPPDYFSKTGQRWGNPVYDWAALKKSKFVWWISRIEHNLTLFDSLRIDHFRGFASFWQIPAQEKLAVFGKWVDAQGEAFFKLLLKNLKGVSIIAEDLGEPCEKMTAMMKRFNFPGMRVLLFAFGGDLQRNPHVPANYQELCVAYTGTHDNNTVQGWYHQEAKEHERANLRAVLGLKPHPRQLHWQMIEALMKSKAATVIIPMVDVLGLKAEARMNTPATKVNNWKWRLEAGQLNPAIALKLLKLTRASKRIVEVR